MLTKNSAANNNQFSLRFYNDTPYGTVPSVTTILKELPDNPFLLKWRKSLTYTEYNAYMEKAINRGNHFHEVLEKVLRNNIPFSIDLHPLFYQLVPVMEKLEKVYLIEQKVYHSLGFGGRCDAVIKLNGKITLVDWKTKNRSISRGNCLKEFCQLTAYAESLKEMSLITVDQIAIIFVVDQTSRKKAGVFTLDFPDHTEQYWRTFKQLLNQFNSKIPF